MPPNNDKYPGGQFFSLHRTTIFPTGGRTVSFESSTWRMGNSKTFLSGLYLPFLPSHSMFCTQLSSWFNFTTVYIAPLFITLKTAAIHPTSSILSPPQKASPLVMQSCLLPPPWLSCSQAAAAWPPPWPSCSSQPSTTFTATIVVTLTPLGLTTSKATGQAIGWTATSVGPVST